MFPVVASFARRLRPKESPDEFLNATNVSKSFSGALQAFSPTTSKATFSQWAFDAPFARSLRKLYFCVSQLSFWWCTLYIKKILLKTFLCIQKWLKKLNFVSELPTFLPSLDNESSILLA